MPETALGKWRQACVVCGGGMASSLGHKTGKHVTGPLSDI